MLVVPAHAAAEIAEAYLDILRHLPARTQFEIVVQASVEPEVRDWLVATNTVDRARLHVFNDGIDLSIWAQDSFLTGIGPDGLPALIQQEGFSRKADGQVSQILARGTGLPVLSTAMKLDGGNILVGQDFLLIGADSLATSQSALGEGATPDTVTATIARQIDPALQIYTVGSRLPVPQETSGACTIIGQAWTQRACFRNKPGTRQPIFHIDMFITLAGPNQNGTEQVLVGDPRLAAQILETSLMNQALADHFDDIAAQLTEQGFGVVRNPLPLIYMDQPDLKLRTWFFASSNNVLAQDCGPGDRTVWLPTYGHGNWPELARTDAANARAWQSLGYKVVQLGNFQKMAENLGALHCMSKVLERGSLVAPVT